MENQNQSGNQSNAQNNQQDEQSGINQVPQNDWTQKNEPNHEQTDQIDGSNQDRNTDQSDKNKQDMGNARPTNEFNSSASDENGVPDRRSGNDDDVENLEEGRDRQMDNSDV